MSPNHHIPSAPILNVRYFQLLLLLPSHNKYPHAYIHTPRKQHNVALVWVPSHKGIPGNDRVHVAAKAATRNPCILPPALLPETEITTFIRSLIKRKCSSHWLDQSTTNNELAQLKNSPLLWPSSHQPLCGIETVLTRLRIGHTRLTHSDLLSNIFSLSCPRYFSDPPPPSPYHICSPALSSLRSATNTPSSTHISWRSPPPSPPPSLTS